MGESGESIESNADAQRYTAEDVDIWDHKKRDDFLHYLKFEYFLFT